MFRLIKNYNLTIKFITPVLIVTLSALTIGSLFIYNKAKQVTQAEIEIAQLALNTEMKKTKKTLTASLQAKIDLIGKFMAKTAPELILGFDFTALKAYQELATEDVDIIYSAYLKPDGSLLTSYNKPANKQKILELRYPIENDGDKLGFVLIGASKKRINDKLDESNVRSINTMENITSEGNHAVKSFMYITFFVCLTIAVLIVTVLLTLFRTLIIKPIHETNAVFDKMSDGDLSVSLDISNNDEIGYMKGCVNKFTLQFKHSINAIVREITQLNHSAGSLGELSGELSQSAEQQLSETTQVATSMAEMTSTTAAVAQSATAAAEVTSDAAAAADEGKKIVSQAIEGINALASDVITASQVIRKLQEDSGSIGTVLDVIKGIAEQTNLLALNAAIEAARAGEQGRGFAVVADEVRTLAGRTQQSTQEIQKMIERLQGRASEAVGVIEKSRAQADTSVDRAAKAGNSLASITHAVTKINDMNVQIASELEQQVTMVEEVKRNIININSASEKATMNAENTSMASNGLTSLAGNLAKAVHQFKT